MQPPARRSVQGIGGALNALTALGTPHARLPVALTRVGTPAETLELRELRYFAAAARTGNIGRAAQDLGVTASAISQQLRKLEDTVGTPLLIRHGRGVTATPAGARLLQRIDSVLRLLNAPLEQDAQPAQHGGTIALSLPAELAAMLAPPVLAQIRRGFPALTLALRESGDGSAEGLLAGQTDIAVLPDAPELDELRLEHVLSEPLGLAATPSAAVAQSALPLRLRDLARMPLILPGRQHWIRRLLTSAGFQRGVHIAPAFQADSLAAAKAMVRQGLGCAVLPAAAVREETARGALTFRVLQQPALAANYAVGVQSAAPLVVHEIAHAVAEAMRALAASSDWPDASLVKPAAQPGDHATPETAPEPWRSSRVGSVPRSLEFAEGD